MHCSANDRALLRERGWEWGEQDTLRQPEPLTLPSSQFIYTSTLSTVAWDLVTHHRTEKNQSSPLNRECPHL